MKYRGTIAFAFVAAAIVTLPLWYFWASYSNSIYAYFWQGGGTQDPAAWGDSFGGFNAFFGSLGFAAVVATLLAQLKSAADQQADQHRQRFDATFFEMLKMIKDLRSELKFKHSNDYIKLQKSKVGLYVTKEGRDAIAQAASEMLYWITSLKRTKKCTSVNIQSKYMLYVHGRYESRYGPYFRMVYTILVKISRDKVLSLEEKVYYGNIVRSQLNKFEAALLAINALSPVSGNMRDLITEFRLLKYVPSGTIRRAMEDIYPKETFTGRSD